MLLVAIEFESEIIMKNMLECKGELVNVNGHNIHVYRQGNIDKPKIVLMAGSATVAPVYDFKVIYEKLENYFRIIVIEKFGYGYSDIYDNPADVDTLVSTQKQALEMIEESGPYILMPHSMSGLEALRWKQIYPNDVKAIIGIDMATPLTYSAWTDEKVAKRIRLMEIATKYKLYGILCPLNNRCLTKAEIKQQKLLRKRNSFNICYINEAKEVLSNVENISKAGYRECPTLLFSSNGQQLAEKWTNCQKEFASLLNAKLISYDCGHYIHYYKSDEMCKEIIDFVNSIDEAW